MLVQNWKYDETYNYKYNKPDVQSKLHHHFNKYSMQNRKLDLMEAGNQQKFDQYQLGTRNQLIQKPYVI